MLDDIPEKSTTMGNGHIRMSHCTLQLLFALVAEK